MNSSYTIRITASKWTEAYIDLKRRTEPQPRPIRRVAPDAGSAWRSARTTH
jgi:hypothetical protein